MENIFKLTREQKGLSLQKLATKAGISKSTIIRTEQGLYPLPSPKLIKALDLNYETSVVAYQAFQIHKRMNSGYRGNPSFFAPDSFFSLAISSDVMHPLVRMLASRSLLDFCKAFCIKPDLVTKWVSKPHLVVTIPVPILEALKVAGYPDHWIIQLSHAYRRHREYVINQSRKDNNIGGVA